VKAERLCGDTQFTVQRGKRKVAPLGELKIRGVIYRELETIGDAQCLAPSMGVGMMGFRRETVMISLEDCIGLCGLDEEQVAAISEHEHIPAIAAARAGQLFTEAATQPEIRRHRAAVQCVASCVVAL
jgi:hypothetical protein